MEKSKLKNNSLLKIMATILLLIFCSCFLVGCVGSMGGSGSSSGGSGSSTGGSGSTSKPPKEENPYKGKADTVIDNFNDIFMGAIGVYEVDSSAQVFYDNYTQQNVNFNFLVDRQFTTLATVIYDSLMYVYGPAGSFSGGILNNYGSSTISFEGIKDNIVGATIYRGNVETTESPAKIDPKYTNAMYGTYDIVRSEVDTGIQQTDAEGNPVVDGEGNPVNIIEIHYDYSSSLTSTPWRQVLTSANDLIEPFKNLYKTHVNGDLKTIGFTEEYKTAVLNYINDEVIGSTRINESNSAKSSVFNGTTLKDVDDTNYEQFDEYKGYDVIVENIVNNAFKLVKEGNTVKLSSNYSYLAIDWETTLFPNLGRYEYVFYDDVDDICDAEANEYPDNFDADSFVPDEDYAPDNFDPDYNFKEDGPPEASAKYKVGRLRKIKEIILLPKVTNKTAIGGDTFSITGINIAWARPSSTSECSVKITTDVKDNSGNSHANKIVKLDDGTYSFELPGGSETMSGGTRVDFVTEDGRIIVDEVESSSSAEGEGNKIAADIFSSSTECQSFKFGDLELSEDEIKESFTSSTYTVESTSETIGAWKLNVCNNLVLLDNEEIYKINFTKNVIRFKFEYFNSSNTVIDIPELYLMNFTFNY